MFPCYVQCSHDHRKIALRKSDMYVKVIEVPSFAAMLEALVRMPRVNNCPAVMFTLDDGLASTSSSRCIHTLSGPVYDHLLKGLETIVYSRPTDSGRDRDTGTDYTVGGSTLSLTSRRQSARPTKKVSRLGLNDKVTQGIANYGHKCYAIVIFHILRHLMELNSSIGGHELLGKLRMMSLAGKASVGARLSIELCNAVEVSWEGAQKIPWRSRVRVQGTTIVMNFS